MPPMDLLADLHNHSCLSPCGALEMSPRAMARRAKEAGIGLLGLCDHNSALNCPTMEAACAEVGIGFIPGIEVTTMEECHLLCLFPTTQLALDFGREIESRQPKLRNDPERLGDQVYVDLDENILGEISHYLGVAIELSLEDAARLALSAGGIALPAHIDRARFSVKSQLGFLPEGPWTAVEAVHNPPAGIANRGLPLVMNSDAHYLRDMGRRGTYYQVGEDFPSLSSDQAFAAFVRALTMGSLRYRLNPAN